MREGIIKRLMDAYPNDADLGKSIRELYRERLYNRRTILRYAIWGSLFYLGVIAVILLVMLIKNFK